MEYCKCLRSNEIFFINIGFSIEYEIDTKALHKHILHTHNVYNAIIPTEIKHKRNRKKRERESFANARNRLERSMAEFKITT